MSILVRVREVLLKACIVTLAVFCGSLITTVCLVKWALDSRAFWLLRSPEIPPSCLQDPQLGVQRHVQLKSIKLHYVENGDRSKPLLILLHGFPEFWYAWRHQLRSLADEFWIVAPDLRGYGDSGKPFGKRFYTMDNVVDDIKGLIVHLERSSCHLIGSGWGAGVAWEFAAHFPSLVEKLVIINGIRMVPYLRFLSTSWKQMVRTWYDFFFRLPLLPEIVLLMRDLAVFSLVMGKLSKRDFEAYRFYYGKSGSFLPPLQYYRNLQIRKMLKPFPDQHKQLPSTQMLAIIGWNEMIIERELMEQCCRSVEECTIRYVAYGGHFVHWERPDATNMHIREFLAT